MFTLPDLPYPADALEPVLSAELMRLHHDKHHAAYVNTVNKMLGDAGRTADSLEDLVRQSAAAGEKKLFNNAGQAWNHAFFWLCMSPQPSRVGGALGQAIDVAFGGLAGLKTKFVEEGVGHFGSGWVWLVAKGGQLSVISTHDAEGPLTQEGVTPILVCDVWEHAYYLVHKNDRKAFLDQWFDRLANWTFAEGQFSASQGVQKGYLYPKPVIGAQT
ncbi:MAG TPA: superoxide dismutase [Caulobacteraceae bacterium]|jgi:Fe-Mn family superoxide dismutase|nr:superoxide dismutase [Caulobacteraceae bacterium]